MPQRQIIPLVFTHKSPPPIGWRYQRLAEAVNQYLEKGSQFFVEGELRGDASDGSQNPRIWIDIS